MERNIIMSLHGYDKSTFNDISIGSVQQTDRATVTMVLIAVNQSINLIAADKQLTNVEICRVINHFSR